MTMMTAVLAGALAAANPFPAAKPAEVGLDLAAAKELAARVRLWVDQEDTVGAELLVIQNRRTVRPEAYGLKELDDREPLTPCTIAGIRAMTKPIVGTAIQILADEGKLA